VGDAFDATHRGGDAGLEMALDRAAGGRQRHGDVDDSAVLDVDRPDHLELDDVAPELRVDDHLQRLEDLLSRGHGFHCGRRFAAADPASTGPLKTIAAPQGARRRLREERYYVRRRDMRPTNPTGGI